MSYGRIDIDRTDDNRKPHYRRTFDVTCHGHCIHTTVTARPSVARDWLYKTRHLHVRFRRKLVVGLGVQWRPGAFNTPATLQLCVGRRCLVFQLHRAPAVPRFLRRFLSHPRTTFVGVWNHQDRALLKDSKHNLSLSSLLDIRDVAADLRGYSKQLSMETLAELILGLEGVTKPISVGMSDWEAYWLDEDQIQYACLDAFVSFSLGKALKVWKW
ncbi:3'-5' exonuclease-like [Actinidia eriantha]|uniref:3'-5' exonuclease-like n=1 Tax=Actinidia eriantha TaxID=165200 RepID=UPI00258A9CEB|nr:3'-5' exonuclease-like [Actinidia eriantha]